MPRRDFIRLGALSYLGVSMADLFRVRAAKAGEGKRDKACILLWMLGGPSHIDTFDPKPDAPDDIRGPLKAIETNVRGIRISEHLQNLAKQMDKCALIRSVTHPRGDHEGGLHYIISGNNTAPAVHHPPMGSVIALKQGFKNGLPPDVSVPYRLPWFGTSGFLGETYNSFVTGGDPNAKDFKVRDVHLADGMTAGRLLRRKDIHKEMDSALRTLEKNDAVSSQQTFTTRAYDMIFSPAAKLAFNLNKEPAGLRDKYGRTTFGQSCLLARRLVEAGVRFVTVAYDGWDTHSKNFDAQKNLQPTLDKGFAALLEDLHLRGMLDDTVVMWTGEFGRTPKIDYSDQWQGGRHHWPYAQTVVLAGGGIRGGQVIGSTNERAEVPKDYPLTPADVAATVLHCLGIDHNDTISSPDGRPIHIVPEGKVIPELV
jgi:hypothetical protein